MRTTRLWHVALVAVAITGCDFTASQTGAADAAAGDAPPVAPDAPEVSNQCYGPASPSPFQVCLGEPPSGTLIVPPTVDTSPGSGLCLGAQPAGWTRSQREACFVVADTIMVATTTVTGSRPLVLVGRTIVIATLLDVSSRVAGTRGPGGSGADCAAFGRSPASDDKGGGGGAGGSFATRGGDGGGGDGGKRSGGDSSPAAARPASLRGGCDGQRGGSGDQAAGAVGAGGGALYVVAGARIQIDGDVTASGAAAGAGGQRSGGSGGGTGGMIVLFAPTIDGAAVLTANGGGGASGEAGNGAGAGGNGGPGSELGVDGTGGSPGADETGGGGGGGGAGYIRANVAVAGTSSPPVDLVP